MEKIKVMLICANDNKSYELKKILKDKDFAIVGVAKTDEGAYEKAESLSPNVILIYCASEFDAALKLAEKLYVGMPDSVVVMLCDNVADGIMERAMKAGVRNVLVSPTEAEIMAEQIRSVFLVEKARRQHNRQVPTGAQSNVITVFGPKGGIGKTTIAVNLAVTFAQMGKKTAIIDADLQFGDVNVYLDLDSKKSITELVQSPDSSDIDAVRRIMVLHQSGVSVLCAPKSPEYAEYVTPENLESIINTIRPYFDYIIIDTTPLFNDVTMAAIENANLVLMISGIDISTLRNTKISLAILESLQQSEKTEIVVNKVSQDILSIKEIQKVFDKHILTGISSDSKIALTSHNKGIPVVLDFPGSKIAKELKVLAKKVEKLLDH